MKTQLSSDQKNEGRAVSARRTDADDAGSYAGQHRGIQDSPYMAAQRRRIAAATGRPVQKENKTNMPDTVKTRMEASFDRDFSDVRVHADSARAPEVGALAYTQGTDIHFAPGQYTPDTSSGRQLLGHELAHVVQQDEGRVSPTTEVSGMPVNDSPSLEKEADMLGSKAAAG